jgi:2-oxoglutarate ferredoxin oxidoreductase subunit delta
MGDGRLKRGRFVVHIIEELCKGCGICVGFCPAKVLAVKDNGKVSAVEQEKCIGCKACENRCPDYVFEVEAVE